MGKRSDFKRRKHDKYYTPEKGVLPLVKHLPPLEYTFWEPCAGDGRLIQHIEKLTNGECVAAHDIEPDDPNERVRYGDALCLTKPEDAKFIITNPPWTRELLHPMIEHFRMQAPTWLLFDANWSHTKQAIPYMKYCSKMISVGRLKWIEDSKHSSLDDVCWYLFTEHEFDTMFFNE